MTHVALNLGADFDTKLLYGSATLNINRAQGSSRIVLDTRELTIQSVTDASGSALSYQVGATDPLLGAPLTVELPEGLKKIVVNYHTSPDAAAVQWLTPEQTSSGKPFLFTQGQAILTRTWIPTQDSPGIRQSYEAAITVPAQLTAVMSAEGNGAAPESADANRKTFRFHLDQRVPPYLIALAIGDLEFRELGPRTGVWSEPSLADISANEFVDVEKMIDAAAALYGPYRWGRYDLLVLPPSFPFGGMENPMLTFATPTILAGDRSLVSLVAHELAHSWSGNLVTNATWDDFWLNEGFTSYFENRIMESLYGAPYAHMLESLARGGLDDEIRSVDPADQHLHLNLAGRDPDDGMNAIAYDKGALFLRTMEDAAGRERFDRFVRGYFDTNAFQPMTSALFIKYLDEHLIQGDAVLRAEIAPEAWIYGPGIPANAPRVVSEAFARVEAQAEAFMRGAVPSALQTDGWSSHEWVHFINSLPSTLTDGQLTALNDAFNFSTTGNSEIRFAFLKTAITSEYLPAIPSVEAFLLGQGRRKYVLPLFVALQATDWGRPFAQRIYRAARPMYHSVTSNSVDAVVGVPSGR